MDAVTRHIDLIASLLDYPDRMFKQRLAECRADDPAIEPFVARVSTMPLSSLQELYTKTFDFSAGCTLDIGWHLFGERPERGAFLADLRPRLRAAGVEEGHELPDYLPHLVKLLARLPAKEASALNATLAPGVDKLLAALSANGSPYEPLVKAAVAAARAHAQVGV